MRWIPKPSIWIICSANTSEGHGGHQRAVGRFPETRLTWDVDLEQPSPVCWVEASGEKVSFWLSEKKKRVTITGTEEKKRPRGRSYEDVPSGVFEFSINTGWGFGRTSSWKDGKIQRIESKLDQIVATIPLAGEFLMQERIRREKKFHIR